MGKRLNGGEGGRGGRGREEKGKMDKGKERGGERRELKAFVGFWSVGLDEWRLMIDMMEDREWRIENGE